MITHKKQSRENPLVTEAIACVYTQSDCQKNSPFFFFKKNLVRRCRAMNSTRRRNHHHVLIWIWWLGCWSQESSSLFSSPPCLSLPLLLTDTSKGETLLFGRLSFHGQFVNWLKSSLKFRCRSCHESLAASPFSRVPVTKKNRETLTMRPYSEGVIIVSADCRHGV